ncbi:hypothetical protein [Mycobacterium helveticum]|uniref:DUF5642 domain-containing protein n=1 Tax=Mycobacterium helveticum TaxID=2592811 RepID=A0A557Y1I5_9MYCO|nr:hypothetical protein [Mycobacterium helveticum]TVS89243.1 hypothetical protein FPZ46_02730 [Mycobacterium helveticum]TVS92459.1 hypothetical protein FPZ47_00135 [Mycobacterium helveticum]
MQTAGTTVVGWALAVAVGAAVCGCGNEHTASAPSPSSTTTSASTPPSTVTSPPPGRQSDYSVLLVNPADIGPDFTAPQPPVLNPDNGLGVAQLFVSADSSRRVGDIIVILADPAAAATGVENTKNNYAGKVSGTWQPVDVGSNGARISGTSGAAPDDVKAVTVLVFTEGNVLVNLEFDSPPSAPMDPGAVIDIGRKQDAVIKNALPG